MLICFNNKDIRKIDTYKAIAIMSQMSSIYFGYTSYDTIMMGRYANYKDKLLSMPSKEDKDFVIHYMEKLRELVLFTVNVP